MLRGSGGINPNRGYVTPARLVDKGSRRLNNNGVHARQGSFGRVFLGKWRETTVAIKLLSQPLMPNNGDACFGGNGVQGVQGGYKAKRSGPFHLKWIILATTSSPG
jgi:hypothetical protein